MLCIYGLVQAFSTLMLLVGRRKEHPTCKNWVVRCWCGCLSAARCRLFAYAVVKVDRKIRWHYTTTILSLRIGARLTRYRNCKFHNGFPAISRHADGISRYSVPPSAGPLLPLCIWSPWCHCHPKICRLSFKSRTGFTFPVPAYPGCPGKKAVKRVYVCMFRFSGPQMTSFFPLVGSTACARTHTAI